MHVLGAGRSFIMSHDNCLISARLHALGYSQASQDCIASISIMTDAKKLISPPICCPILYRSADSLWRCCTHEQWHLGAEPSTHQTDLWVMASSHQCLDIPLFLVNGASLQRLFSRFLAGTAKNFGVLPSSATQRPSVACSMDGCR
jgi:hypothetical protein